MGTTAKGARQGADVRFADQAIPRFSRGKISKRDHLAIGQPPPAEGGDHNRSAEHDQAYGKALHLASPRVARISRREATMSGSSRCRGYGLATSMVALMRAGRSVSTTI